MDKKVVKRGLLPYLFIALFMLGMFYLFNVMNKEVNVLTYDEFVEKLDGGKALVFAYTFTNKSQNTLSVTFGVKEGSKSLTTAELGYGTGGKNLVAKFWDGDSWENAIGHTFTVDKMAAGDVDGESGTFYVYISFDNPDFNAPAANLNLNWDLA